MESSNATFLKLAASWNCGGIDNVTDVDCDAPFSESAIVKTHEPVSAFTTSAEIEQADGAKLFLKQNHQIRSGLRRGDLFVADFGDFRLVAFTGEGVIKDAA